MLRGIGVSEGIGIGNAYIVQDNDSAGVAGALTTSYSTTDFTTEKARYDRAIHHFLKTTEDMVSSLKRNTSVSTDDVDILLAHTLIAKDEAFTKAVEELLSQGLSCELAVTNVAEQYRQLFLQSEDEALVLRAADVLDVKKRLIAILTETELPDFSKLPKDTILIIKELLPSMVASVVEGGVIAVVTQIGGRNSHAAILARAAGLPMISGVDYEKDACICKDTRLIADAYEGVVFAVTDDELVNTYKDKLKVENAAKKALEELADKVTATKDGRTINLYANIMAPGDVGVAIKVNADGVGLFRTEHIFMSQSSAPDEESQYREYTDIADAFIDKPVVIRTLDIGGDKEILYFTSRQEQNPFLGHRAIRFCLDNIEIFKTQLKALIRAGRKCKNIRILIPLVACIEEVKKVKQLVRELAGDSSDIKLGVMIETPAAVFMVSQFAKYVDFFSIGTNDLTQYMMAADRGNDNVAELCSHYQPAVLRAIAMTVKEAASAGREVELCGEAAADTALIPVLIGMGLTSFSVSVASLLKVRKTIAEYDYTETVKIAEHVLSLETEAEIKEYLT